MILNITGNRDYSSEAKPCESSSSLLNNMTKETIFEWLRSSLLATRNKSISTLHQAVFNYDLWPDRMDISAVCGLEILKVDDKTLNYCHSSLKFFPQPEVCFGFV